MMFHVFENDVKEYGIQTIINMKGGCAKFENDVKEYGIQTEYSLRVTLSIV